MTLFMACLIGGLITGAALGLIVVGMVLIYRATDTFNFAQGQFMLLPAYLVGQWQTNHDLPFILALGAAVAVMALIAVLLYRVVLYRTIGMPLFIPVIATLGFASILDGVINGVFRSQIFNIRIPGLPRGATSMAGVKVSTASLVLALFSLLLGVGVAALVRYSSAGARLRAVGQDALLASQGGVNVRRVYVAAWTCAAVLAALGGVVYGSSSVVSPSMLSIAFLAFPALLLGGFDSVPGALLGGLGVGLVQSFTAAYIDDKAVNVTTYSLLLLVLLIRPQGLLGTEQVNRV